MKHSKIIFQLLIIILLIPNFLKSQTDTIYKLSLNDAIEFGYQNNVNITNAELEVRKAKWKVWETTAIGLPQVNASAEYQNFPDIPTQLMPNFLFPVVVGINTSYFGLMPTQPLPDEEGKIPVQFGSKHNLDWGVSVSQLIFSGEYIVGLQAAKTYKLLSTQNQSKAKIELKINIEKAYYLALIATESRKIIEENYQNIKKISENNQKMADEGIINQTQADQIKILELNIKNQISALKRQEQLSMLMLKFQLGMIPQDSIILTDSLSQLIKNLDLKLMSNNFDISNNIDYQMLETQVKLKTLNLRRTESKTLPQISAYYSYSKKAMLDTFNFFDKGTDWFPTSVIGIKFSLPIFSSGMRSAQIQQNKIDLMEAMNQQQMFTQQLNLQYIQAKNDYINSLDNLYSQKQNMQLSDKIYKNTLIQYQEGTASSNDLTQAQNQFLQAESSYYQALMQSLNAKASLEKLLFENNENIQKN